MSEENDPLEFEVEEEDVDTFDAQRQINTDKADSEIGGLREKHQRGRLNLHPSYQRNFVWDVKRMENSMCDNDSGNSPSPV